MSRATKLRCWFLFAVPLALKLAHAQQPSFEVNRHLAAAQSAQRSADYPTAEREYRAAIALMPNFAELHMNLGLAFQMQSHIPEAMVELRRAVELKPGLAGANLMLGIDLCKTGHASQAIPYLATAGAADRTRIEASSWLATAQEMSGDYPGELHTIESALRLQPENVDLQYLLGHVYEALGRQEALATSSSSADPALSERLLAESYATSAEWPSAVIHFQKAIAASTHPQSLHVELGEVLLRAGKIDQAQHEFAAELHFDPASIRAIVRRGEAELLLGHPDPALADWSQALRRDPAYTHHLLGLDRHSAPDDTFPSATIESLGGLAPRLLPLDTPASRLALAYISRQEGKEPTPEPSESPASYPLRPVPLPCPETDLRKSVDEGRLSDLAACGRQALPPSLSPELRIAIASALLELGDPERSIEALATTPGASPEPVMVNYLRARCFEALAAAAYLQLYQAHPESFRVHQLLGDLAAARDDDKKAIAEYRAALALKPSTPNLHYSLAHVLWKESDIPAARVEYDAELAITPAHAGALHDLGQTYLMEHDPAKALSFLNQAVAAGADGPDLNRDLGTAYAQLGQYRNAEAKYTLALPADRDGSIHFRLARVYRALGEKEKAAQESAQAADLNRKYHGKMEDQTPQLKALDE